MFDPATLFFSLVFGTVGVIALKRAKGEGNISCAFLGIALLVFPYFIDGWIWNLLVGSTLTAGVWKFWDED